MRRILKTLSFTTLLLACCIPPVFAQDAPGTNAVVETPATNETAVVADAPESPGSKIIEGVTDEWLSKIAAGGRTIIALMVCSVIGLAFALERLFMLRRGAIVPRGLTAQVAALWRDRRFEDIEALCRKRRSTLARILAFIVKHRRAPMADVSTAAGDIGARELKRHLLRAYPLAVVATISPLLGLLGTVIGMIEAFDTVVLVGMGDATALAGGISKALITTMVGLCIAVPALFAYHLFKNRTQLFGVMLEEEITELIASFLMETEDRDAH